MSVGTFIFWRDKIVMYILRWSKKKNHIAKLGSVDWTASSHHIIFCEMIVWRQRGRKNGFWLRRYENWISRFLVQDVLFNVLIKADQAGSREPTSWVCVCVCAWVSCLPVCLRLNKGVFCISVLSGPSSASSLTFYCELLGDWQKRSAVQPFWYICFPPTLPSTHPSIHLYPSLMFPSISQPLPHVCFCFPFPADISNPPSLSSPSVHRGESSSGTMRDVSG